MSTAFARAPCAQRQYLQRGSWGHGPRLLAARPHLPLPLQPAAGLRAQLLLARGQVLNTEYNESPEAYESEAVTLEDVELANPLGLVGDIMHTKNLRSAAPDSSLRSADSKLDKVTGLPVVDAGNMVIGVISKKDMNRLRKQGVSFDLPVSQFMSTPPLVMKTNQCISEAAAVMLERKIHRLPVVDDEGRLLGIVSRTDVFNPLMRAQSGSFDALGSEGSAQLQMAIQASIDLDLEERVADAQDKWVIKYLYDGDCSMCQALVAMLKRQDAGRGLINFVNIASISYNARENEGIEYEDAMETIHAIKRDGTIMRGTDALKELYSTVGLGWAATLGNLPLISELVDLVYNLLSKFRIPLGEKMDAVLALRRMKMTSEGIEHCVDDEEECHAEW